MKYMKTTWTVALTLGVAACSPQLNDAPAPAESSSAHDDEDGSHIDVPVTIRNNLGITFVEVESRHVEQTLRVPGAFELQPRARREYRMSLPGRVELHVDQYDVVEAGALLFRFQTPEWPTLLHEIITGEQEIESTSAQIEVGKARLLEGEKKHALLKERLAALEEADFKSADLELQLAELEVAFPRLRAELVLAETHRKNAARTREHALHRAASAAGLSEQTLEEIIEVDGVPTPTYMTIDWIEVHAVESGVVSDMAVTDGAFVEAPGAVLTTVNPDRVRFRALALQGDLPRLSGVSEARIVPPQSPGHSLNESVPATMSFGLDAHPEERTMTLLATPAETGAWMRPGVSAFLEVVVDSSAGPALAIPRAAVLQEGLTHVFFRRDPADPNVVLRVEADMGVDDGRWVVLHSGVMLGDQVVLNGNYELLLSMAGSSRAKGGHMHADGTFHEED